jgi:ParB/RepB/Spo0J family partition protein
MTKQFSLLPETQPKPSHGSVALELINVSPYWPKPPRGLLQSIKLYGLLQPVILAKRADGRYTVWDGKRRVQAAADAEMKSVRAMVYETDAVLGAKITLMTNSLRQSNAIAEFEAIQTLMRRDATIEQIREATGLDDRQLAKRLLLLNLRPELKVALCKGSLAIGVAGAVAGMSEKDQKRLIAVLEETGRITYEDVAALKTARVKQAMAALPDAMFADERPRSKPYVTTGTVKEKSWGPDDTYYTVEVQVSSTDGFNSGDRVKVTIEKEAVDGATAQKA